MTQSDRRRITSAVVMAAVAVALAVVVGCMWMGVHDRQSISDARRELRSQAGVLVAQVISERRHDAATESFARRAGLNAQSGAADGAPQWTPRTVAVVDADATSGTVLIDATVTSGTTSTGQTVTARLVSQSGQWRVDQIDVVR